MLEGFIERLYVIYSILYRSSLFKKIVGESIDNDILLLLLFILEKGGFMNDSQVSDNAVRVEFTAEPLPLFGRALLTGLLSILVIPAPWMAVWFYRWGVSKLKLSDNTEISFTGTAAQIWFPMMLVYLLALPGYKESWISLILLPLTLYLWILIFQWFVKNITLGCGTRLSFTGSFWEYLGYVLLCYLSIVTIVGWAWVARALIKWFCRHIKGGQHKVEFTGTGSEILWRTLVTILACVVIIPIPWITLWLVKWYASQFVITKVQE